MGRAEAFMLTAASGYTTHLSDVGKCAVQLATLHQLDAALIICVADFDYREAGHARHRVSETILKAGGSFGAGEPLLHAPVTAKGEVHAALVRVIAGMASVVVRAASILSRISGESAATPL